MRLFSKLFLIMIALGAMGLGLLALRQQRYEVSNEISRAHNRIVEQERAQWRMRADVARRSDPADIRTYASKLKLELIPAGESTLLAATPAEGALGEQVVAKVVSSEAAPKVSAAKKTRSSKSSTTGRAKVGTRER
ncbi:MAG: hypothetical protein CK544_05290 [Planctomycetaceae bacterium]|nr:MAG: hypothetical protein CK544_05290 [Planctomycetaceae bacterium]